MSGPARGNHQISEALLDTLAYAAYAPADSAKVHLLEEIVC